MQKKGQVSEQFNWIFAGIAGGIILLLFIFVIGQLQESGNAKIGVKVLNSIDTIIAGSENTKNSVKPIAINNLFSLSVTCFEDSRLYVGNSRSSMDINNRIIFAPTDVGEKQLFIATKELYRPFPLGNAILLSDESTLFAVFDPTSGNAQEAEVLNQVYNHFPDNISKIKVAYFQTVFKQYKHIAIVSTVPPPEFQSVNEETYPGSEQLRNKQVVWIEIPIDTNSAKVYTKTQRERSFSDPKTVQIPEQQFVALLAYSPSAQFYECTLEKLQKKLNIVTEIYLKRIQLLQEDPALTELRCQTRYANAENILTTFSLNTNSYLDKPRITEVEDANRDLLLASCPVIY